MFWSYLTNSTDISKVNTLTFESGDNLNKLCGGYCELVIVNFFSSFSHDYDSIFVSEFGPDEEPFNKKKRFFIKFNDKINALEKINTSQICT